VAAHRVQFVQRIANNGERVLFNQSAVQLPNKSSGGLTPRCSPSLRFICVYLSPSVVNIAIPFPAVWHSQQRLCYEATRNSWVHGQFSESAGVNKELHRGFLCLRHNLTSSKRHPREFESVVARCRLRLRLAVKRSDKGSEPFARSRGIERKISGRKT
jgi:hypothetical protein